MAVPIQDHDQEDHETDQEATVLVTEMITEAMATVAREHTSKLNEKQINN